MTPLQMYFLILLTKLPDLGFRVAMISSLVLCVLGMFYLIDLGDYPLLDGNFKKIGDKSLKWLLVVLVVGIMVSFFGVDLKQLTLIYGIPAALNNEQVQKLPNNVLNVVNTWLEEQVKETK